MQILIEIILASYDTMKIYAYLQKPSVDTRYKITDFVLDMTKIGKGDNDMPYYVIDYQYKLGVVQIEYKDAYFNSDYNYDNSDPATIGSSYVGRLANIYTDRVYDVVRRLLYDHQVNNKYK